MKELKVEDVMTRLVVKLYPNDTIHEAASRLAQNDISGAPVVQSGKVVGIISEADLVRAAMPPARVDRGHSSLSVLGMVLRGHVPEGHSDAKVGSVMSDYVVTIAPTATIWDAAAIMERHGIKRLPVVEAEGELVGIISRADLVKVMARTDAQLAGDVISAVGLLGDDATRAISVTVEEGVATLRGRADRRTTRDLVVKLARNVPGIVEVVDRLDFEWDDTKRIPRQKDPWAVGPLVKQA